LHNRLKNPAKAMNSQRMTGDRAGAIAGEIPGIVLLLLLIQAIFAMNSGVLKGSLLDTDTYVWLVRVLQIHDTHAWFDHSIARINPPDGYTQHWTRPFDVLLYTGAWLASPVAGFAPALHGWSVLISPLLEILTLFAMYLTVAPLLSRSERAPLGLLFVMQISIIVSFQAGRADHQTLILLLFVLGLAAVVRMLERPFRWQSCYFAGAVASLGIWVSVESLLAIAATQLSLGLLWIAGIPAFSRKLLHYSSAVLLFSAVALLLEHGTSGFLEPAMDQLSVAYLTLLLLMWIFWASVVFLEHYPGWPANWSSRILLALSGAVVTILIMSQMYPGFLEGPWGGMDKLYRRVHHEGINELEPLISPAALQAGEWRQQIARFSIWAGILFPGLAGLLILLKRSTGQALRAWIYIGINVLVYLPLTFLEIRWVPYIALLMLPGYSWLVSALLSLIGEKVPARYAPALRILTLTACALVFIVPSVLLAGDGKDNPGNPCPLMPVSRYLDDPQGWGDRPRRLLAHIDFGPELLYRTKHSVYSIPSHRFNPGFTDSYNVFSAADDGAAKQIVESRGIDLVLVCNGARLDRFYARNDGEETLRQRLIDGDIPAWLHRVELPGDLPGNFLLYEVQPEQ
jgi:hypothetical protein